MPKASPSLRTKLDAATSKTAWSTAVKTDLGSTLRVRCFRDAAGGADPYATGTEFLNCAMAGPLNINATTGAIDSLGALSGVTLHNAVNLATGSSCLRIEGNGLYLQYSLGLSGSGKDFTVPANIAPGSGFAFTPSASLVPPTALPISDAGSGGGGGGSGWGTTVPPVAVGSALTTVGFENYTGSAITNSPVTFGQVFQKGALPASGAAVSLKINTTTVPAQLDVKATHADGSVRHAVISAVIPSVAANTTDTYNIIRANATAATPAVPADFTGLNASVSLTIGGMAYTASITDGLTSGSPKYLQGDVCTEWVVAVPLKTSGGASHPLLHARFYVRGYKGQAKAKIDVSVENTWIKLASNPATGQKGVLDNGMTTVTADVVITVGGTQVYSETAVKHYPYARWKQTYWWNTAAPSVNIKRNVAYIIGTGAVPNYDTSLTISQSKIASNLTQMGANANLMSMGMMTFADMGSPSNRAEIAIVPGWDVVALLSQNKDAVKVSAFAADRLGGWSAHLRNYGTDKPLSLTEAPYFGFTVGSPSDAKDPNTGVDWNAPPVAISSDYRWELGHHPDPNFLPYLMYGDMYYAEGLEFWANMVMWKKNPGYRLGTQGLIMSEGQTREIAWAMRTLTHAAYLLPDSVPSKATFDTAVRTNITYAMGRFPDVTKNKLAPFGVIDHYFEYPAYSTYSGSSSSEAVATPPWQQDHLASVIGRMVELGFPAQDLFTFSSQFAVKRLTSGSSFCYIFASSYVLPLKATTANGGQYFTTMDQVWQAHTTPTIRALACGSQAMADYIKTSLNCANTKLAGQLISPGGANSFDTPNLMQPALAYAKTFGVTNADNAWTVFTSDPNYRPADVAGDPQYTILPR